MAVNENCSKEATIEPLRVSKQHTVSYYNIMFSSWMNQLFWTYWLNEWSNDSERQPTCFVSERISISECISWVTDSMTHSERRPLFCPWINQCIWMNQVMTVCLKCTNVTVGCNIALLECCSTSICSICSFFFLLTNNQRAFDLMSVKNGCWMIEKSFFFFSPAQTMIQQRDSTAWNRQR